MKATLDNVSITLTLSPAALKEAMENGVLAQLISYAEQKETPKTGTYPVALETAVPASMMAPMEAPPFVPTQKEEAPAPVPTAAPGYTYEQLARAAAQLMDAGKQNELIALIQKFGVSALNALPKEQYGPYAMALIQMGAKI